MRIAHVKSSSSYRIVLCVHMHRIYGYFDRSVDLATFSGCVGLAVVRLTVMCKAEMVNLIKLVVISKLINCF